MAIELAQAHNVYMDESRQDRYGVPIYSVSGYISTFDGFIQLEKEWKAFLFHKKIDEFHATDFIAREKQFKNDWTNVERNAFIDRLAYIASEYTTLGFGSSIREDTFYNTFGKTGPVMDHWRDPFGFCLWSCFTLLLTIEEMSRLTLQKPLYILFDNKPEFEGTADRIFHDLKQLNDPKGLIFGDFGFASKNNAPSLQAADLITYQTTRHWIEKEHKGDAMEMHRVVKILERKGNLVAPRVTDEMLQDFKEFLDNFVGPMPPSNWSKRHCRK
jgi:hypothetical protein